MFSKKNVIYSVYKYGGFSKAAEALHIPQPSLSVMVSKVEKELGEKLFDRGTNPVKLTYVGEKYIECCESINMIEEDFTNFLSEFHGLESGEFKLGGSNLFMNNLIPSILAAYSSKHPGINVSLIEHGSLELRQMLIAGDLDIVIDNELYDDTKFDCYPIGDEYLLIAVPRDSSFNSDFKEYAYTYADISAGKHVKGINPFIEDLHVFEVLPFIQMHENYDTRTRSDEVFSELGIKLDSVFELDQLSSIFAMASSGLGAAVVSDTIIRNSRGRAERLYYYPVNHDAFKRTVSFYTRRDRSMSNAIKELVDITLKLNPLARTR